MGKLFGYARVSTSDQDLTIQLEALKRAGCDIIRSEKASGKSRQGREELELLLTFLREGDTLVVTRVDRLARSVLDLQVMVADFAAKGINLRATEQPIDTSTPAGKMFFDVLSAFAEFETRIRRERQAEGIIRAKAEGKFKGGTKRHAEGRILQLIASGMGPAYVARELGCSRQTVYRAIASGESR